MNNLDRSETFRLVLALGIAIEKPTMVTRDKALGKGRGPFPSPAIEADTERIGEESNAVSGRHGAVFLHRISDSGH